MAKIPFDIKYRPQIESGEYKVETRDGLPARVVCWDANSYTPIVCLITEHDDLDDKDKEYTYSCNNFGRAFSIGAPVDLFIVTPEEELTEFEQQIENLLNLALPEGHAGTTIENTKRVAAELLALARKEIIDEWSRGLHDTQDISGKAYNDGYLLGLEEGKAEALKDLPRWSKNAFTRGCAAIDISGLTDADYIRREGKLLNISDLEKLPGFKED